MRIFIEFLELHQLLMKERVSYIIITFTLGIVPLRHTQNYMHTLHLTTDSCSPVIIMIYIIIIIVLIISTQKLQKVISKMPFRCMLMHLVLGVLEYYTAWYYTGYQ